MESLRLPPAGPGDSEFAYRTREAAFRARVEETDGWDEVDQRRLHDRRFASYDYRIIEVGGVAIGILCLAEDPENLRVNQIFILPEHQGMGHGGRCMAHMVREARRRGRTVRLRVLWSNPRARRFFGRLGFEPEGETDTHELLRLPVVEK